METTLQEQYYRALKMGYEQVVDRLFVIAPIIRPSSYFSPSDEQYKQQFEQACASYYQGEFLKSLGTFENLFSRLDEHQNWFRRFVIWNIAACAIALNDNNLVIRLLQPMYSSTGLYGLPLWNLAIALYRENRIPEALQALKSWVVRNTEANPLRDAKVELIIACLSEKSGDETNAKQHLMKAIQQNSSLVIDQLKAYRSQKTSNISETTEFIQVSQPQPDTEVRPEVHKQLIQYAVPRRPDRPPALSQYLISTEMERYSRAVEAMAEGEFDFALRELNSLRQAHPNVELLQAATASALLFLGNAKDAGGILTQLWQSGYPLNGAALWNLACAQIHLSDFSGALKTLKECAKTEYRSKPQLWKSISILSQTAEEDEGVFDDAIASEKDPIQAHSLIYNLPSLPDDARTEVLRRILKPRKLAKYFRPDLSRLSQRDRQSVTNVLDAAHRSTIPSEAANMLLPLVNQYGDIYTLKAHAGAYFLLAEDYAQARTIYRSAEDLQKLDSTTCLNYAYLLLYQGDTDKMIQVLDSGTNTALANDFLYWIALAIAREVTNQGSSGDAAAQALALVLKKTNESMVREILRVTNIRPSIIISTENQTTAAVRKAFSALMADKVDSLDEAVNALEVVRVSIDQIPEISAQVWEPAFVDRPYHQWNEEIAQEFHESVCKYVDGHYAEAVGGFSLLYRKTNARAIPIDLSAAFLKTGEYSRAKGVARSNLNKTRHSRWIWRLAYNLALAYFRLNQQERAIKTILQYKRYDQRALTALLVAICGSSLSNLDHRTTLVNALEELRHSVYKPSEDLMINLVWAQLTQQKPQILSAKKLLQGMVQLVQAGLQPAAEVKSMAQVRAAFDRLRSLGENHEAVSYMTTIIETRNRQRQSMGLDITPRDLEHSIGVEFAARVSLVRILYAIGDITRAIRELSDAEDLLKNHVTRLSPGYVTRDWYELATVAKEMGFCLAVLRYCESGLKIETDNPGLLEMKNEVYSKENCKVIEDLNKAVHQLRDVLQSAKLDSQQITSLFSEHAPLFLKSLNELTQQIERMEDNPDLEELCDRASAIARLELPETAYLMLPDLNAWVLKMQGGEEIRLPMDVDVYDERIWPRNDDDREGSCLITLSSRVDIKNCILSDPLSERKIWEGELKAGHIEYIRWTFYREEGYTPESFIDLPLQLEVLDTTNRSLVRTSLNVIVGNMDPVWPIYPTGALTPDDVPSGELYGRFQLIRTIIRSLGRRRSQATFFIQAPRQMGKTSLLNFVEERSPDYLLSVYINLEKEWSKRNPKNLWNYMIKRLREESLGKVLTQIEDNFDESNLVMDVADICKNLGKDYILFLMDEFHFLFEKADDPSSLLASFRDFLNIRDNRIALLLADRYTRDELEKRCPSEYWAQLSLLNVGPLDLVSTRQAIEFPTRGTDVSFLPETVDYIYQMTRGYPYHVQRAAQYILENMYSGPWLTALPSDLDSIMAKMLDQDILFQSGLCRPDRIDAELFEAIAALLEWQDLCEFILVLMRESGGEEKSDLASWQPDLSSFVSHIKNHYQILARLGDIGVLQDDGTNFFSPMLLQWLKKMRRQRKNISGSSDANGWQLISTTDGVSLSARDWQNLDSELVRRTKYRGKPPLREKTSRADDWEVMVIEVRSENQFVSFIDATFRLFIDDRDEKSSMLGYPWLYLAYHRIRLARNYVVHRSKTQTAMIAWNAVCMRALGGERNAYWPSTSDEWRAIQAALLRTLYAGMHNAIELAGIP